MKTPVEISCGAKLKGVSTRRPHKLKRPHMKKSPCVTVKYENGLPLAVEGEKGASIDMLNAAYKNADAVVKSLAA